MTAKSMIDKLIKRVDPRSRDPFRYETLMRERLSVLESWIRLLSEARSAINVFHGLQRKILNIMYIHLVSHCTLELKPLALLELLLPAFRPFPLHTALQPCLQTSIITMKHANDRTCNYLHMGPLIQSRNASMGVLLYPTTKDVSGMPCAYAA